MVTSITSAPHGPSTINQRINYLAPKKAIANQFLSCRVHGMELDVNLRPMPGEGIMEMFSRLHSALQGAKILGMLVFGSVENGAAEIEAIHRVFGRLDWPLTWVEGGACDGTSIAGVQVTAWLDGEVHRLIYEGQVMGSLFQEGGARHCILGGVGPVDDELSPADQTSQTLETLETILGQAGFALSDTVRTWFFSGRHPLLVR